MSDIAIRVENLSKQYRIGKWERYKTLRDTLTDAATAPFRRLRHSPFAIRHSETIWALKDVSFEACPERSRRVKPGEVVGIPSASLPSTTLGASRASLGMKRARTCPEFVEGSAASSTRSWPLPRWISS